MAQGAFHHHPNVDRRSRGGAPADPVGMDDPARMVHGDKPQFFLLALAHQGAAKGNGVGRGTNSWAGGGCKNGLGAQLAHQRKQNGGKFADAFYLHEGIGVGPQHGGEAAIGIQQPMGQRIHIPAGDGIGQQQFQKLMIVEALASLLHKLFAQAFPMVAMILRQCIPLASMPRRSGAPCRRQTEPFRTFIIIDQGPACTVLFRSKPVFSLVDSSLFAAYN